MGDGVGQLLATGQHGLQLLRHLVEGAADPAQAATGRQTGAAGEIAVTDPAGGLFKLLQAAPVRAQPEQDRQPQRETDDQQQPHIDPVQLVQVGEIGYGADDQHLIGARNALQEGVILLDDDDVAGLQEGLILVGQRLVGEGADLQRQGELAALFRHAGGPVLRWQAGQLTGEQAEGALHHPLQIAISRPLGGDLIDHADQQDGQGETADQQQIELDKQAAHGALLLPGLRLGIALLPPHPQPFSRKGRREHQGHSAGLIPRRGVLVDNPSGVLS